MVVAIGAVLLLPPLLWMVELFVRSWPRGRSGEDGAPSPPFLAPAPTSPAPPIRESGPPDESSQELLAAEALAVQRHAARSPAAG